MIDPHGVLAPYLQLAAILREQIQSGELSPNARLPSIVALSEEHHVSRAPLTMRSASWLTRAWPWSVPGGEPTSRQRPWPSALLEAKHPGREKQDRRVGCETIPLTGVGLRPGLPASAAPCHSTPGHRTSHRTSR